MRRDAVRNRRKLLEAAGETLRTEPGAVTMAVIAERASLSPATAYRYFPSVEEVVKAYLLGVIVQLRNYSHDCPKTGPALFEDVSQEWARLVRSYGPAMVQIRSRTGFLTRLRNNDEVITPVRDAWERPIRTVMRHLDVPDEHFDHALFLCNAMFDPREILDLISTGLTEETAISRMTGAYYGALQGWARA
ncbi:TetR family transcriptional regulator [Streptomyces viridochromogenes]|uniref:TetR family transcriptional regulator n=1 Tax=Streptomyces viridochromogenes TaxID=1938 RepID=A0A0J7ZBZ6_STRVR|nr:TetR/AcrR family transcriptional regulator [Streptomyces viridochromogenes]KMS73374.1 TetR family transcriptional regulator [Streptomyces viridochromogenes]KOG24362.1 TetR family transcriptional regulator [Streptomyces viridochromogenes]KOG25467.1 TetR family transcriptional regulator [Streptomyces viridochromogenes]